MSDELEGIISWCIRKKDRKKQTVAELKGQNTGLLSMIIIQLNSLRVQRNESE